jgi:hypothetical protein
MLRLPQPAAGSAHELVLLFFDHALPMCLCLGVTPDGSELRIVRELHSTPEL